MTPEKGVTPEKLEKVRQLLLRKAEELEEEAELLRTLAKIIEELSKRKELLEELLGPHKEVKREEGVEEASVEKVREVEAAPVHMEAAAEAEVAEEREEPIEVRELRDRRHRERVLARVEVYRDKVVILPTFDASVRMPPFEKFLVSDILEYYKNADEDMVRRGKLRPEDKFDYEIVSDEDGTLKKIIIRNYRTSERLDEILKAVQWTLGKMYERVRRSREFLG